METWSLIESMEIRTVYIYYQLVIIVGTFLNMARGRFCSRCGFPFANEEAKFFQQCGMSKDGHEVSLKRGQWAHQNEEPPINIVIDFRGPLHIERVGENPTLKSPSYNTIFNPPPIRNRKKDKVYGKLLMHKNWAIQHSNLKDNNKQVKNWIKEGQEKGVLLQGTFTLEDT